MTGPRVLVVDDEAQIRRFLTIGLEAQGYAVSVAGSVRGGLERAALDRPAVIVLDLGLPDRDGQDFITELRGWADTPILVLSVREAEASKIAALDAGADDYLVKPYAFSELLARIEALGRRRDPEVVATRLQVDDLILDRLARNASRGGKPLTLQPREFKLLECMMQHEGQVLTRTMLLEKVWDYQFDPHTNVVDVHIARLRQKVDRGYERPLIHTVRGAGYRLSVDP